MQKEKSLVIKPQPNVSIEAVIQNAIDKGVPVETMERLLSMRRELKQEAAKEAYDRAMAKFQSECPVIQKTKEVKTRSGVVAYRYAPIESIVDQVKKPLQDNGFSYSTNQKLMESGVKVTIKVTHSEGHSEETEMEVPFGNKTDIMSNSQVTAAASTFAKRYAFCNAFGILTGDEDTDGADVAAESSKFKPYKVERVIPEEKVIQMDDDSIIRKKKIILHRLQELDPLIDIKDGKMVKLEVESRTHLVLEEDNYDEIASRLQTLVDEKRGV